jgi:flagellar export protein FliJ
MRKFRFRLQRVLNFRKSQEQVKKFAYLYAVAERQRAEAYLFALKIRRDECLAHSSDQPLNVIQRQELQEYIARLEAKIEEQKALIHVLKEDENRAREKWNEARKASRVLLRLKEHAYAQWQQEANREEQKQLDEFANSRNHPRPLHPKPPSFPKESNASLSKGGNP